MPRIPYDVSYGGYQRKLQLWTDVPDREPDDDDELRPYTEEQIALLGFDPGQEDWDDVDNGPDSDYLLRQETHDEWDEDLHPRVPAGTSEGGQFTSGGGGGGAAEVGGRRGAGAKADEVARPERGGGTQGIGVERGPVAGLGVWHDVAAARAEPFRAAVSAAKAAHPFGASVTVHDDYRDARPFLGDNGRIGVAVRDGDIISLFKHPESTVKGAARELLSRAVAEGGRRLDAFDTELPVIYGNAGFRAVARIKFDPAHAPADWDEQKYAKYNNGRPDVVFMVYDPSYRKPYAAGDGKMVDTYDEAVAIQKAAVPLLRPAKASVHMVPVGGVRNTVVEVVQNPSHADVKSMLDDYGEVRALRAPTGDLYIWRSGETVHEVVRQELELPNETETGIWTLAGGRLVDEYADESQINRPRDWLKGIPRRAGDRAAWTREQAADHSAGVRNNGREPVAVPERGARDRHSADFNPYHDELGRFAEGPGGGSGGEKQAVTPRIAGLPEPLAAEVAADPSMRTAIERGVWIMEAEPLKYMFSRPEDHRITVASRIPEGVESYQRRPTDSRAEYYDPRLADLETVDGDTPYPWTLAKPKPGLATQVEQLDDPDLIYRGMSADEYDNIVRSGRIVSRGDYNIGDEQVGLTYWSTEADTAEAYANGFAPWQYKATFDRPAYVVAVKRPEQSDIREVKGTGEHEVGVARPLARSEIVAVWRGDVFAHEPGYLDFTGRRMGGGKHPSSRVVWKRIDPQHAADFNPYHTAKAVTRKAEFKRWFGASKVTTESGKVENIVAAEFADFKPFSHAAATERLTFTEAGKTVVYPVYRIRDFNPYHDELGRFAEGPGGGSGGGGGERGQFFLTKQELSEFRTRVDPKPREFPAGAPGMGFVTTRLTKVGEQGGAALYRETVPVRDPDNARSETLYHATHADFSEFRIGHRGAVFLARKPSYASKGAAAGQTPGEGFEHGESPPDPDRVNRIINVEVQTDRIHGLALTPREKDWWRGLPDNLGEEQVTKVMRDQPQISDEFTHRFDWYDVYEEQRHGDESTGMTFSYRKRPVPQKTLAEVERSGTDVYGQEVAHWAPEGSERKTAERMLRGGMAGWLQRDEAGLTVAVADPGAMQITRRRTYAEAKQAEKEGRDFNPYHDELGRFAEGPGGSAGGGADIPVFHGSKATFERFKVPDPHDEIMVDRAIGVHVARDPKLSEHFVRLDPAYGSEGRNIFTGGIYLLKLPADKKFLEVEQPQHPYVEPGTPRTPGNVQTDQTAIANLVYKTAFQQDHALFSRYLQRRWHLEPAVADDAVGRIMRGEATTLASVSSRDITSLDDYIKYDGVIGVWDGKDRALAVKLFHDEMRRQGYAGLKYLNTSPMETAGVDDPTSYVVFDPDDVKFRYKKDSRALVVLVGDAGRYFGRRYVRPYGEAPGPDAPASEWREFLRELRRDHDPELDYWETYYEALEEAEASGMFDR